MVAECPTHSDLPWLDWQVVGAGIKLSIKHDLWQSKVGQMLIQRTIFELSHDDTSEPGVIGSIDFWNWFRILSVNLCCRLDSYQFVSLPIGVPPRADTCRHWTFEMLQAQPGHSI